MLKWTVSRSLSTNSSTPHGPPSINRTSRRPFRDLSNTPPASGTKTKNASGGDEQNSANKSTSGRRRRCRSHGSDLKTYFQASKSHLRPSGKRQSMSRESITEQRSTGIAESFYQSTPRIDTDIGPITFVTSNSNKSLTGSTLPTDPSLFLNNRTKSNNFPSNNELPQNVVNEARANLQSHVSDFFQQISLATSPEDVMETESVSLKKPVGESSKSCNLPKLTKITKIHQRCKTPHRNKIIQVAMSPFVTSKSQQTPLAGKLSYLMIDQDMSQYENMDNLVTEVINREQETNFGGKTVAEILLGDIEERKKVLRATNHFKENEEHIYESIIDPTEMKEQQTVDITLNIPQETNNHNDSSVLSASQLLENPSPLSWPYRSPCDDLGGEFTLKRQRGIRRKRQQKDAGRKCEGKRSKRSLSLSPSNSNKQLVQDTETLIEAVNPNVKKLVLETDLDSTLNENKINAPEESKAKEMKRGIKEEEEEEQDMSRKTNFWDLESPKSSLTDDFQSSKSFVNSINDTPEAPLVATVRRCLKFSPENELPRTNCRGSIEIEYSVVGDHILVRVIRCKDLRRAYEGPVNAYVKASLKNNNGEGVVKRTAVHRATPNPVFHETLILPCPANNNHCTSSKPISLDIAVWHRDRRARRSELLGCMTLPLPLSQDKEATWHPLEAGSGRNTSTLYTSVPQDCGVSPPLSKEGPESDNNNSGGEDLTYLRHLELEPVDPLTGLPVHPGFAARGGRTPCTVTRRLIRQSSVNQIPWGFSLSWGRPPRVERVDPGSPAERSGLRPGDYVVFVDVQNVVIRSREEILALIQAATNQLVLEIYRKTGFHNSIHRASTANVTLQPGIVPNGQQHAIAFSSEVFAHLAPDASPEEELSIREARYWGSLKNGHTRFMAPFLEKRDILAAADYLILFQNLEELLKLSEEIRDEGGGIDSYLTRVPKLTAAYRRYLSGLQRACCLLVALRRNTAFAKVVCEPAVPHKRKPDLTGVLLMPLEHYREMTRLICLASPKTCQQARNLAQGYREATANAGVMEPPRDTGKPLLSLQEVESRLVFARCKPFTLAMPGRQWLFGGALAKVEGRGRLQPSWALLLTDLLVFARVSRDRVLFVTEEPLRLNSIGEACFNVRKRPTEFRLQIALNSNGNVGNGHGEISSRGGCSPHSRPRRRVIILRAPSPELKAVWHNLLQRQIIYVNTVFGGTPSLASPEDNFIIGNNFNTIRDPVDNPQEVKQFQTIEEEKESQSMNTLDTIIKNSNDNHLAQWVRDSHQIPPPDQEGPLEEWTPEELAARAPRDNPDRNSQETSTEDVATANSDVEQQSTASSASLSTVKSSNLTVKKNGTQVFSKENSSSSINICKRCHRSGCPTPPLPRDPFSPLPPKISVLPPTPDLCTRHRLRNGFHDSPNYTPADGNTEDGSEDDLDCDGEPPYRVLRRFGTMSSLDQDDELDEQGEEDNRDIESPPSGLRAWTARASNYVVSKMVFLEQLGEGVGGYLLHPPVPPERTEFSMDPNDEEGTTSGATSGDDIWGTPTSGGPDDESFTANSLQSGMTRTVSHEMLEPASNGSGIHVSGEENYGLNLSAEDDPDQESENEDCSELSMDQLLGGGSVSSLRCFLNRRRLEPLPEEEDSPGSGKHQVGWW